jgi:hypothetical protein
MKAIDRSETGDIPRDPVALRRLLAVRAPAAKTILASDPERSHQQAGHMDATDPIKNICQNTLQAGAVHISIASRSLAMTAVSRSLPFLLMPPRSRISIVLELHQNSM